MGLGKTFDAMVKNHNANHTAEKRLEKARAVLAEYGKAINSIKRRDSVGEYISTGERIMLELTDALGGAGDA